MGRFSLEFIRVLFRSFFFNDTATTEIYTLSLHDALPIYIRPRALHFSYLADLIYIKSYAEKELVAGFEIQPNSDANDLLEQEHKQNVRQAIEALEQALRSPGPYGHRENPNLQRSDIEEKLALWRKEVGAN